MSYIKLENVYKKYLNSDEHSVTDFNLEIEKGEFIVFVGPSGCGKSTTIRMIAGLEDITEGNVVIDDKIVNNEHPKNRDIAMVFQNYALYPHMTVEKNISFSLDLQKMPKDEIKEKVDWASNILGLTEYLERKPKDLSGGQRQRVALGRAIVRNPKLFLMDEPLSNLDAKLRVVMRNEITKLHRELGATTIYVTHDQIEAMTMANRIVVMRDGAVQQIGEPMELYDKPANVFVASFIGAPEMNILEVEIKENHLLFNNTMQIEINEGILKQLKDYKKEKILFGFRPEHVNFERIVLENNPHQVVESTIDNIEKMGNSTHIFTYLHGKQIILRANGHYNGAIGEQIKYRIDINKSHFFDIDTKERV